MFSKPKLYLYLKRNALEIYKESGDGPPQKLDFPKDIEKNEEIINPAKFEQLITGTLKTLVSRGQKVIIILSDEVIFQKIISAPGENADDKIQKFLGELPFDPAQIAQREIATKNGLHLIAANKDLYEPIIKVVGTLKGKTESVIAATLFGMSGATLQSKVFENIDKNGDLVKDSNLLAKQPKTSQGKTQKSRKEAYEPEQTKLLIVSLVLMLTGLVLIIYYLATHVIFKKP